jgi:hypothetical protein
MTNAELATLLEEVTYAPEYRRYRKLVTGTRREIEDCLRAVVAAQQDDRR